MQSRSGARGTEYDSVFFTEDGPPGIAVIQHLHVEISLQNANLNDVKQKLAQQAKAVGANAVINFRYGQKAHKWWEQIFTLKWDTESWHGEGDAVRLL